MKIKNKRKLIITFTCVAVIFGLIYFIYYNKKCFNWYYKGQAVVLTTDSEHTFIDMTEVTLDGKVFDFGKYFLGDLRIGIIEKQKHFHMEPDFITKGMMTDYHYFRNLMEETYFKTKKVQEKFRLETQLAQTFWNPERVPNTKMLYFIWKEWFGGKADAENTKIGYFYFNKAGSDLFVIETLDYLIVPGVSTREEALIILHDNFSYLDWFGFEQALELE